MPKSYKQASRKAAYEARVAQAAALGTAKSEFQFADELSALQQACGDFINRVQQNLQSAGKMVSGSSSNVQLQPKQDGITIILPPSIVFIDKGVNGSVTKQYDTPFTYRDKMPPVSEILDWMKRRNINTRNNEKYSRRPADFRDTGDDEKAMQRAAYAIAVNIKKHGMAPVKVYSNEIPQLVEDVRRNIAELTFQQITEKMEQKK